MASGDYPAEWETDVVLADGATLQLRPIRPCDREALRALFGEKIPLTDLWAEEVKKHYERRPWVPLAISGVMPREVLATLPEPLPEGCALESVYVREYPQGDLTAHLIGYIGVALPDQRGPIGKVEYEIGRASCRERG